MAPDKCIQSITVNTPNNYTLGSADRCACPSPFQIEQIDFTKRLSFLQPGGHSWRDMFLQHLASTIEQDVKMIL